MVTIIAAVIVVILVVVAVIAVAVILVICCLRRYIAHAAVVHICMCKSYSDLRTYVRMYVRGVHNCVFCTIVVCTRIHTHMCA